MVGCTYHDVPRGSFRLEFRPSLWEENRGRATSVCPRARLDETSGVVLGPSSSPSRSGNPCLSRRAQFTQAVLCDGSLLFWRWTATSESIRRRSQRGQRVAVPVAAVASLEATRQHRVHAVPVSGRGNIYFSGDSLSKGHAKNASTSPRRSAFDRGRGLRRKEEENKTRLATTVSVEFQRCPCATASRESWGCWHCAGAPLATPPPRQPLALGSRHGRGRAKRFVLRTMSPEKKKKNRCATLRLWKFLRVLRKHRCTGGWSVRTRAPCSR